jgi:hypothetical protein
LDDSVVVVGWVVVSMSINETNERKRILPFPVPDRSVWRTWTRRRMTFVAAAAVLVAIPYSLFV